VSLDRRKTEQTAQKFFGKGQYEKAIAEYQKIVRENPRDVRTWLKIGDLYTRAGQTKPAVETYTQVAEQYVEQGFLRKAVAVYSQILKLDPSQPKTHLRIGELYLKLELVGDSLLAFEQAAESYRTRKDYEAAMSVHKRMVELAPKHVPSRVAYAESLATLERNKEAIVEFERAATDLKLMGRVEEYIKIAERLFFLQKSPTNLAKELARIHLNRRDTKRALAKLQICFKKKPNDTLTLELLAEAFEQLGKVPKAISVYKEAARLHREEGFPEEQIRVLQKVLDLNPNDPDAQSELASFRRVSQTQLSSDRPEQNSVQADTEPPIPLDDEDLQEADDDVLFLDDFSGENALATQADAQPGPSDPHELIQRWLSEAEVYRRYGLKNKVVEQLRRVLNLDPLHVEARESLKDYYLEQNERAEAIQEYIALANQFSNTTPQRALNYLEEALRLEPQSEVLLDQRDALLVELSREPEERELEIGEGPQSSIAPPRRSSTTTAGDVEQVLEETEGLVFSGQYVEALARLRDVLRLHPHNPLISDKINEVEQFVEAFTDEPSHPTTEQEDTYVLAARLAEEFNNVTMRPETGSIVLDVQEVFSDFKEGITGQLGIRDTDTHFDLGIAYKEMGLLDEAIREFHLSMTISQKECVANTMIGLCYMEKNDTEEAIRYFKKGLAAEIKSEREELGLFYELGLAYERLGDGKEARYYYDKVYKRDPHFRNVGQKLEALFRHVTSERY